MKYQKKVFFARFWLFFLSFALLFCLYGCAGRGAGQSNEDGGLVIMTWNLHNFFDASDSGNRYDQFRASAGWSREKYLGRLNAMAAAVQKIEPVPDIIAVQEAGSAQALEDLAGALPGYQWTHFANNPGAPIGLGIISRHPLKEAKAHSININGITAPRPVQEIRIKVNGQPLVILNNHWKSKVGGADATEGLRKASARVVLRRVRELAETEPGLPVIILGDLNVNHDDFFRRNGVLCALLPDDPLSAALAGSELQTDFLIVSRNKPPAPHYFHEDAFVFYSPWFHTENGSFFFRNSWQTLDHFLLSSLFFSNTGWNFESFIVIDSPPFTNSRGRPAPFNPRTGTGMSDHLPLLLVLRMSE